MEKTTNLVFNIINLLNSNNNEWNVSLERKPPPLDLLSKEGGFSFMALLLSVVFQQF